MSVNLDSRPTSLDFFTHWKILLLFLKLNLKQQQPKIKNHNNKTLGERDAGHSVFSGGGPLSFDLSLAASPFCILLETARIKVFQVDVPLTMVQTWLSVCFASPGALGITGIISLYRWSSSRKARLSLCPQGLARTWTRAVSLRGPLLVLPAKCWDHRCVPPCQATQHRERDRLIG